MIRILFLLLFFFNFLFSNVTLKSTNYFIAGEPFSFTLEYSGSEEPTFPNLDKIDGFSVQSAGRSNQISIINGKRSQIISQKYVLFADKDFTIPSIEVKTSSNTYKTHSKNITLQTPSKSKSNDFDLSLKVDKHKLYVGEQAILTLSFKYRLGQDILNMELNQPNFDGFWAKPLGKSTSKVENGFEIHTLKYVVFPQRVGKKQIQPVSINIAVPDNNGAYSFFRAPSKVKRFYSNSIDLDISELPDNLKLIGDFRIESTVDKTKVEYGEAVSYKIKVEGTGNLDDLDEIKLNIPNATIYENKAKKEFVFKDGKYGGIYTKTFSIVANSSFDIDSVFLEYFDSKTKSKKTIKTKKYSIEVVGEKVEKKQVILQKAETHKEENQKEQVVIKETSFIEKSLFFFLGAICSLLLIFILYYFKKGRDSSKEEFDKPLLKVVKSTKEKNELLKVLSPYIQKDESLDQLIYELEDIEAKDFRDIKKRIETKLKKLDI